MSENFFQEGINEAIGLLEESQAARAEKVKIEKWRAAVDLVEKLTGLLTGLKGREEEEFAKLMRYSDEFLRYLRDYETARDKSNIAAKMEPLAEIIARQAQKIIALAKGEELEKLSLRHSSGQIFSSTALLERDTASEKKIKEIVMEHSLVEWKKKEAKEFALLMSYLDNYLKCLGEAKKTRDLPTAIERLRKAKIFGILVVKQAKRLTAPL